MSTDSFCPSDLVFVHIVLADDFPEFFPTATNRIVFMISEFPQFSVRIRFLDGSGISKKECFRFLDCEPKEYN